MGCFLAREDEFATATPGQQTGRKLRKAKKNYTEDPMYAVFIELDAVLDNSRGKDTYILQGQVVQALAMQGIECKDDGREEFEIMDSEFRGHVRFKDFCRFVKKHRQGKAYEGSDSSISDSEIIDNFLKDQWREIDPERTCKVPVE